MDMTYYKRYEPIFGSWYIVREIGEGSFGKVFEMEREDFGRTYKAALKAVTIPQNQSEIKSAMADGMDKESATTYFRGFVAEMVDEFALMSQLKGHSNIVSYEDHAVRQHETGIGWDILIRMELLTPFVDYVQEHTLSTSEVIKLGIDMCKALEACRACNIIHRDIKPENIFVSKLGDFKLGDFGIAKTVEKTAGGLSKKGTYLYMAPEVYKGEKYGPSVDIYSLGIVLYRYLNGNRTPFLKLETVPTYNEKEQSITRRVNGEVIPAPANANEYLSKVILKACAYRAVDRYTSPTQMREDLEAVAAGAMPIHIVDEDKTVPDNRHVHKYTAKVISPTCTEKGYTVYTCECGESYKDSFVEELDHDFKHGKCTRCGVQDPEASYWFFGGEPPKPHTHVHSYTDSIVSPTCTEKGYTVHACTCGERRTDSYVDALGHDYIKGKCTRCGAKDPTYVPPIPKSNSPKLRKYIAAAAGILAAIILCFVIIGGGFGQKAEKQLDWAEWADELPAYVTDDNYSIEERTLYRSRNLETTSSTTSNRMDGWELYDTATGNGDYGAWSYWSATAVSNSDSRQVETQTRYRYRDKKTTTSTASSLSSWTLYDTEKSFGSWSKWSDTPLTANGTLDVETRQVENGCRYEMGHWCAVYTNGSPGGSCSQDGPHSDYELAANHLGDQQFHSIGWFTSSSSTPEPSQVTSTPCSRGWDTYTATNIETIYKTQYRSRSITTTYYYYRWKDWSSWSTNAVSSNNNREVQTATFYRYRDRVTQPTYYFQRWTDWSDYTESPVDESDTVEVETKTQFRYKSKET